MNGINGAVPYTLRCVMNVYLLYYLLAVLVSFCVLLRLFKGKGADSGVWFWIIVGSLVPPWGLAVVGLALLCSWLEEKYK